MSILLAAFGAMSTTTVDVTPNAVNWANISSGTASGVNANQTVNGCGTSITLSVAVSGASPTPPVVEYSLDGGGYVTYSTPFSVDAATGQTLNFRVTGLTPGTNTGTVTVTNDSDGSATLDTFTYSVSVPI